MTDKDESDDDRPMIKQTCIPQFVRVLHDEDKHSTGEEVATLQTATE